MVNITKKPITREDGRINYSSVLAYLLLLYTSTLSYSQSPSATPPADLDIVFTIKTFGVNVEGTFDESTLAIHMDTLDLSKSFIKAQIFVGSISTGIKKRDEHLKASKYFDQEKEPLILFESSEIRHTGGQDFIATGMITIRGIQKPIELPFAVNTKNAQRQLISEFELNRLDFKVGGKNWTMGDIVKIAVSYEFKN